MQNINYAFLLSRPVWGAWIEIATPSLARGTTPSRPVWGAWIEIVKMHDCMYYPVSRPVWGAWIEIPTLWSGAHR